MMITTAVQHLLKSCEYAQRIDVYGEITKIHGLVITASCHYKDVFVGALVSFQKGNNLYYGEVVALDEGQAHIFLASSIQGLSLGDFLMYHHKPLMLSPSLDWQGRVFNAFGHVIDGGPQPLLGGGSFSTKSPPLPALSRASVQDVLDVGVRAINLFTTACKGQRLGIFAGSGVGKSVLLSMLARFTSCDICVIGLIGERGREVREFLEDTLGEKGRQKSILVVATSDEPPLARRQAAYTTLTIAEYFRDQGCNVLCILDSLTRFAMAQREIGLFAGEPPTTKGYPPSTFVELAQLCERAGPGLDSDHNNDNHSNDNHNGYSHSTSVQKSGFITGMFSVLVDGDDHNEPVADAVRGILDGHIVLDRALAERGIYPAINILKSISRLANKAQTHDQRQMSLQAKKILSVYEDMRDLIRLGAYKEGSNQEVDHAIALYPAFEKLLMQYYDDETSLNDAFQQLDVILKSA